MKRSLDTLQPGDCALVREVICQGPMRRRLRDIGFTADTTVTCLGRSPLGDPTAYAVKGAVLALRREDAATILVDDGRDTTWD
ncbi:MAG: ferrous iron transport protein A [Ruminococcaceae bacterium]|nr:ferrous iron transport protein A [Oscillospiraceae bacterium]